MPLQYDDNGLSVQTFDEVLGDIHDEARTRISSRVATSVKSWFGQVWYILAKYEHAIQEKVQQVYQGFDPRLAEGVHLDRNNGGFLGIEREAKMRAEVLGTVTTSASVTIPDGTRVEVGGYTFETIGGPYSIVGAGTIPNVRVRSQLYQAIDVSALGAWSITDAISGWDSFDDDSQPIAGRTVELDAEYRVRADDERYVRASRNLDAIEDNVANVAGVDYAAAYENVDPSTPIDANGIALWAVNVVVRGGTDLDVATAIEKYGPAGTVYQGATEVTLGSGAQARIVGFDRVDDVDMWIAVTCTTSTSEDADEALDYAELVAAVQAALATFTAARWAIGKDALPHELAGVISNSEIPALDGVVVTLSTDDGATDPYSANKRTISIREQAIYADARVSVVEA